jgi:hypothetical protein
VAHGHKDDAMFRTLVKAATVTVQDREYSVCYFELRTERGMRRYSAEIDLGVTDRIILDDDSLQDLEVKARRAVPAMVDSRKLAGPD